MVDPTPPIIEAPATVIPPPNAATPAQVGDRFAAPTSTQAEEDTKLGQRRINLLWEFTQAILAVLVTGSTLFVAIRLALKGNDTSAFLLLSNAFFSVIGVYMTRTNHTKIGGVQTGDLGR